MTWSILYLALAFVVVALVCAVALAGWGGTIRKSQKIGLCTSAAGLLWAAPSHVLGRPPGLADVLFLAGALVCLVSHYGRAVFNHVDELDGVRDGRVRWPK